MKYILYADKVFNTNRCIIVPYSYFNRLWDFTNLEAPYYNNYLFSLTSIRHFIWQIKYINPTDFDKIIGLKIKPYLE